MFGQTWLAAMGRLLLVLGLLLAGCGLPSTPPPPPVETTGLPSAIPVVESPSPTAAPQQAMPPTATTNPQPVADSSGVAEMDAYLSTMVGSGTFSGAVLVARNGTVLVRKGYGLADRASDTPNTSSTRFRLGSVTKPFTAMAILQLQSQGKLDLEDAACDYLDDCPDAWHGITIRHLLTHTSGIPDVTSWAHYERVKATPSPPLETVGWFKDVPLDFQPGEAWNYSNTGYIVLGLIVERASGQPYESFLQEHIFDPLEMRDTGYDANRDDLAKGYTAGFRPADVVDMSIPFAAGGLYSTAEDMYRWDRALYTEELLPQPYLAEMFAPQVSIPNSDQGYGYGWVTGQASGRATISHSGGIEGYAANITRFPDDQAVIIVLTNQDTVNPGLVSSTLAQILFAD